MGSGGGSTTTTMQKLAPEQSQVLKMLMPTFKDFANPATAPGPYQGPRLAGMTPAQAMAQQMQMSAATGNVGDATNQALGNLNFFSSGSAMDVNRNPALQGAVDAAVRPITQQYQNTVLPGIRGDAVQSNMFGSSRQGVAEGLASDAYMRQVGDTAANIVNPAYQAGLDATSRSLAFAPSVLQSGFAPAQAVSQVGSQQQAQQQADYDVQLQKYIEEQYLPLMHAREIAGIIFGMPMGGTVTSSGGGGGGGLMGGLGGAATGAGLGSMVMPGIGTGIGAILGGLAGLFG